MTKVNRRLVAEGEWHVVECAVRLDLTSPADEFLTALSQGMWSQDPDAEELPADAQLSDYDKFIVWCGMLADSGVPERRSAVNYLGHGIWEFKHGAKRLSYYDTPGDGTYTAKGKIRDRRTSDYADDDTWWWYPLFDRIIRLGHAFPKVSQEAAPADVAECRATRTEDLSHDRQ